MKLLRFALGALLSTLALGTPDFADAACTNTLAGSFSLGGTLAAQSPDNVQITGGCIDGLSTQNLLQNGDFAFDQRNEGATVTLNGFTTSGFGQTTVDRWQSVANTMGSGAGSPTLKSQAIATGLGLASKEIIVTAPSTPANGVPVTLQFQIQQAIEGSDIADAGFGLPAQNETTSLFRAGIWLRSSIASAVYGVTLSNYNGTRSYVQQCTVPSAATWALCSPTFSVDGAGGAGLWNNGQGSIGAILSVTLDCGGNLMAPATGAWNSGQFDCTSSQTHFLQTAGATLEIAAAGLYRAGFLPNFLADPPGISLAKLQRFYRKTFPIGTAPGTLAGAAGAFCANAAGPGGFAEVVQLTPAMFAQPLVTTFNPFGYDSKWGTVNNVVELPVVMPRISASQVSFSSGALPQFGNMKSLTGWNSLTPSSGSGVPAAGDVGCFHATFETGL